MRRSATAALLLLLVAAGCGKSTATTVVVNNAQPLGGVYRVPSGSMEPTLNIGSHAIVRPLTAAPKIGDIILFYPPEGAAQEQCGPTAHTIKLGGEACSQPVPERSNVKFIKRVVAGPGDTVAVVEGHVIRNGAREADSYIRQCGGTPECNFPTPITIPSGDWFVLGDNRGESDDSRFWGPVPVEWIIGTARPCSVVGITCVASK
jgi:signal peptidase I